MTLIVHHLQVSQSERIVWLCEELGIPYELKLHQRDPLYSPQAIKDLNPLGQAPVIQDGSITLAESGACAEYIIHKHGGGRLALPPSHKNYADYLYWFHFANGGLTPAIGRYMGFAWAGVDKEAAFYKRTESQVHKYLAFIDEHLKDHTYLAGDEFTAADCMTLFSLTTFRTFVTLDISKYTNVIRYLKTCTDRPGYKSYRAKGDPDLPLMIDGSAPELYVDKLKAAGKL